jgi:hypothetical protein
MASDLALPVKIFNPTELQEARLPLLRFSENRLQSNKKELSMQISIEPYRY